MLGKWAFDAEKRNCASRVNEDWPVLISTGDAHLHSPLPSDFTKSFNCQTIGIVIFLNMEGNHALKSIGEQFFEYFCCLGIAQMSFV